MCTLTLELKYKISNVYKSSDIEGTPKASDINLAFKTIKTSYKEDGMKINALKLVEKLWKWLKYFWKS